MNESLSVNPDNYHILGCTSGVSEINCHIGLIRAAAASGTDDYPGLPEDDEFLAILPGITFGVGGSLTTGYTAEYLSDNDKYAEMYIYDSYDGIVDDYNLHLLPSTQGWPDLPADEKMEAQAGAARLRQSLVKTYTYGNWPLESVSVSPGLHQEIPGSGEVGQLHEICGLCATVDGTPDGCYLADRRRPGISSSGITDSEPRQHPRLLCYPKGQALTGGCHLRIIQRRSLK